MSVTWLIAWRYIRGSYRERALSSMAIICFLGMAIGSGALALVICVMQGFEQETHRTLQGIHSQLIMQSKGNELDADLILSTLHAHFPGVTAASPSLTKQVIIQKPGSDDISHVVFLKGIKPELEAKVSAIGKKIDTPLSTSLEKVVYDNHLLIGIQLAEQLNLKVGDAISLVYPESGRVQSRKVSLTQTDALIGGIFKTGIQEFDEGFAYAPFAFLQQLFPHEGISHIALQLSPAMHEQETIKALANHFNLEVYSWKDLYPALVSALKLEKYAMFFILLLIALVAGMNIVSLLFMHITRKRGDIAIFKAMGMSESKIQHIFLLLGLGIASAGSFCGLLLAAGVGLLLQRYPFIQLPDTYYVTYLPVVMDPLIFIIIFSCVLLISVLATIIPLRTIRTINIAHVLRFEG